MFICILDVAGVGWNSEHQRESHGMYSVRTARGELAIHLHSFTLQYIYALIFLFFRYQQTLHRNLAFLANLADPTLNVQSILPVRGNAHTHTHTLYIQHKHSTHMYVTPQKTWNLNVWYSTSLLIHSHQVPTWCLPECRHLRSRRGEAACHRTPWLQCTRQPPCKDHRLLLPSPLGGPGNPRRLVAAPSNSSRWGGCRDMAAWVDGGEVNPIPTARSPSSSNNRTSCLCQRSREKCYAWGRSSWYSNRGRHHSRSNRAASTQAPCTSPLVLSWWVGEATPSSPAPSAPDPLVLLHEHNRRSPVHPFFFSTS